ncbi:Uncharacterised protein [Mycobacteroides abscessus subsp. abscessus]|uniref:hypothetical protein n=1 Tax=Mycobacteroides abscessus TaxID=36809 RepID=UPI0005E61E93|nr:hypothetical protein [Mycobacteroides abscessus]ANO17374.1 hypothetical protein BAB78_01215 [Mycobacteroides abscessus]MDB2220986.1 hypothetical protein [Mycobacteroides abscessus subsp. abscessus]OTR08822.1 hypothetical protein B9M85_01155 [Mycobacteroides abscessus]CPR89835.1 Uncharacterised protein [Mycobacteroides abscessus]SHS87333.1 Uncharacterised protein [Mycobacteroides abscessus subsp. abscessus]
MTDKITIKEKAAVQARIGELNTHKTSVTDLGTAVTSSITALTAALTATAGAGAEPVPAGVDTRVQAEFNTAAEKVGGASSKLQSWMNGATVIQEDGADKVAGNGDTPKSADPKPTPAKPVLDYQLK